MLLLAVVGFRLFPEKDVTVLNGGQSVRVSATFDAERQALEAADVSLGPGDRIFEGSGGKYVSLAVQRARPVRVDVDGEALEVRTQATTIAGALAEGGIELRPGDRVYLDGTLATARGPLFATTNRSVSLTPSSLRDSAAEPIAVRIERARPLVVYIDTFRLEVASAATTVEGVLGDLGMTVREGDLVRPGLAAPVNAGMTVRLAKARSITVRIDGKEQSLYTQAQTVGDVLALLGVDPRPDELLEPARETPVTPGMTVTVGLTRTDIESVTDPIPPGVAYENDPTMPAGQVRIIEGTPGTRVTNFEVTYKNGEEVSRVLAPGGGVTVQPVATRHITGTKGTTSGPAAASRPTLNAAGYTGTYSRTVNVYATWYNASHGAWAPDDPNYGRTWTGVIVDYGICATDRSVFPMGTRFFIPGYGVCVAADIGGGVRGNHIDLGFPESAGGNPWATQYLDVYVLD
ncbi:MAG: DUF348 domain-containing protein [Dehalococcoidia bacterium]|nr:DUF348 domain-containing protein [Dehalococcoidia bacterium]